MISFTHKCKIKVAHLTRVKLLLLHFSSLHNYTLDGVLELFELLSQLYTWWGSRVVWAVSKCSVLSLWYHSLTHLFSNILNSFSFIAGKGDLQFIELLYFKLNEVVVKIIIDGGFCLSTILPSDIRYRLSLITLSRYLTLQGYNTSLRYQIPFIFNYFVKISDTAEVQYLWSGGKDYHWWRVLFVILTPVCYKIIWYLDKVIKGNLYLISEESIVPLQCQISWQSN
jgi:hypothetical protein